MTPAMTMTLTERAQRYDREHAGTLRALAYRMLGSRAEAEDIVQEAWLRWANVDESTVQHAGAFLYRRVTKHCLDPLGSAAAGDELVSPRAARSSARSSRVAPRPTS